MHTVLTRFAFALLAVLFLSSCFTVSGASPNAIPLVRVHAASDLDCPQSDIQVIQRYGGRFQAIGCGHQIVYNTACDGLSCVVAPPGQALPWRSRPDPSMPLPR